ncbi:MAG: SMP-30/gluconolactonase/LRE family protein [Luteitalea sp.]
MTPITHATTSLHSLLFTLLVVTLAAGGAVVAHGSDDGKVETRVYQLHPSTYGNPEGVAFDPDTDAFFVGATGAGAVEGGAIYRGTLNNSQVELFIKGAPGREAVGIEVFDGRLYVAGGFSGRVSVYDLATRRLLADFESFGAGMLNDLVITKAGEVFITDSFEPILWHITAAQVEVAAGRGDPGPPEAIPMVGQGSPIEWAYGDFNLNGIVAIDGGHSLIVVQSSTGKLFRIDLARTAPDGRVIRAGEIHEIALAEPLFGDGLLLDKGHLVVVTFAPAPALAFVRLDHRAERGVVVEYRTDPTLRGPSTVARADQYYLVVNADFETSTTPFTVTRLPRTRR